uniref:HAT C-terminal dimerisation domain-containing protein n=1 Tax=Aotus nancymaae TaxID=37293 RepID=A0A2K5DJ57_AOTNA
MLEEHHADVYRSDLPNPITPSAKFHCWRIKWKRREKDTELPFTICEFFPNVHALLKVLCILPVMKVENERYGNAYVRNTLADQRSSNLALLNINFDINHDLYVMVDPYIKLYTSKSELPTDNSETMENT